MVRITAYIYTVYIYVLLKSHIILLELLNHDYDISLNTKLLRKEE